MRRFLTVSILLAATICSGCGYRRPSKPLESGALVGTYVYRSAGGPPIHSPDKLTLKADGTYVLIHMPVGQPGSTERGTWKFYNSPSWGGGPQVDFVGRGSYPVEVKGNEVRLLINLDVGHWYQKTG